MSKITIELTEDQGYELAKVLSAKIDKLDYYIKRYDGKPGSQVLSARHERAFLKRLIEKIQVELVKL